MPRSGSPVAVVRDVHFVKAGQAGSAVHLMVGAALRGEDPQVRVHVGVERHALVVFDVGSRVDSDDGRTNGVDAVLADVADDVANRWLLLHARPPFGSE